MRILVIILSLVMSLGLVLGGDVPVYAEPGEAGAWPLPQLLPQPIGHRELSLEQQGMAEPEIPWRPAARPTGAWVRDVAPAGELRREVFGYLPYWSHTESFPYLPARWDLLTVLAWFSVEMDEFGEIGNRRGWGSERVAAVVAQAKAQGLKVVVTITNFDNDAIGRLVNSPVNRARAIDNCLALMAEHGADGVNIDFEFVPVGGREGFVTFMRELTERVRAARPNGGPGHVTLAGPSVDWSQAYDYKALLEQTDGIVIMAYGYHYGGSAVAGPTAPLVKGDLWASRTVTGSVEDYLRVGGVENRAHVYLALPWYGRAWRVAAATVPANSLGDAGSRFYRDAEPVAQREGKMWEGQSKTAYYHVRDEGGQLEQGWYDDGESFRAKIELAEIHDLGGVGIWALGYEGESEVFWEAIEEVIWDAYEAPVEGDVGPEEPGVVEGGEVVEAVEVEADMEVTGGDGAGGGAEVGAEAQAGGRTAISRQQQGSGCALGLSGAMGWGAAWWLWVLWGLGRGAVLGRRRD